MEYKELIRVNVFANNTHRNEQLSLHATHAQAKRVHFDLDTTKEHPIHLADLSYALSEDVKKQILTILLLGTPGTTWHSEYFQADLDAQHLHTHYATASTKRLQTFTRKQLVGILSRDMPHRRAQSMAIWQIFVQEYARLFPESRPTV